jgi:small-conductance mechanosensitive channel
VILILILDQLGFDVTTLVASLGIGGIAVALAVQNILSDLFGSLSIALDKPFLMGDFVVVGDIAGTVEHVGLKTTRIRALTGEQVVVANADLLGSRIHNYKRMDQRRIVFGFGVTYDTPADKLERLPGIVREIIEAQEHARFDRAHFKAFGASSLDYEVVYFVTVADYNRFMDTQQGINLALVRHLAAEGIEFAFPTQTLHLATVPKAWREPAGDRPGNEESPDEPAAKVWTGVAATAAGGSPRD